MVADFCHWLYHDESFTPFIVDDNGMLVRTNWDAFAVFFNDAFESINAGLEFWN